MNTKDQRDIYDALEDKAKSIDDLARQLGITSERVAVAIRYLQAKQKVGARSDTRPKKFVRA